MRFINSLNPWVVASALFLPMVAAAILFFVDPVAGMAFVPLCTAPFVLWMASVGEGLRDRLPPDWHGRATRFRFALAYMSMYFCVYAYIGVQLVSGVELPFEMFNALHLLGMVASIYAYQYVARVTSHAAGLELESTITFFLMLLVRPPQAIWVIQKQVRSIVRGGAPSEARAS